MKIIDWNDGECIFQLSSGRQFTAYGSIIGLGNDLEITGGWDHSIDFTKINCKNYDTIDIYEPLTKQEKIEIANYMISLWEGFKINVNP